MENHTLLLDNHTVTIRNASLWNSTTTANQSEIAGVDEPSWVNFYLIGIILPLGLVGNSLSFIVMMQLSRHSSFYLYLSALALADCAVLFCVFMIWIDNIGLMKMFDNTLRYYCTPILVCNIIFSQFSSWVTVAVSVDRYIAVCHPFKVATYCTRNRAIITLTCIFLAIVALDFPMFCFEWSADYTSCVFPEKSMDFCIEYFGKTDLPSYMVTIAIISVFTLLIVRNLVIAAKRRRELSNNPASGSMPMKASTRKTIVLLIAVVLIFTILSFPVIIVIVYGIATNIDLDVFVQSHPTLFQVIDILSMINHSANFVLYGFSGKVFRDELLQLPCCCRF